MPEHLKPGPLATEPMDLYCAVDIMGGAAVRLTQGDFDRKTTHGDPLTLARSYVEHGARSLHVVDLDAARGGEPLNREAVLRIVREVPVPVQVGGGARGRDDVASLLESGVSRVVVSTTAVENPELVDELAELYPGRIVLGLDHRSRETAQDHRSRETAQDHRSRERAQYGRSRERAQYGSANPLAEEIVAIRGWKQASDLTVEEFLARFADAPLGAVVLTSIARDGMLAGPDVAALEAVLAFTRHPVVASGGVRSAEDLARLAAVSISGSDGEMRHVAGAVVGRALVNGSLDVQEALAACERFE
jgi:phosphoribosylformimino-5-aminoimidazole carboxamide ribotide isomerase